MRAYKLITAQGSPASNKVRAYLRWANLPARETAATALVLKSEVRPRLNAVRVPVLITPSNEAIQDSRLITDWVETHEPGASLEPDYAHHRFAARLIEGFADEVLAPASVFQYWHRHRDSAVAELGESIYPDLEPDIQKRYARILAGQLMNALESRGYGAQSEPVSQGLLLETLRVLENHLETHAFLLGDWPCQGDFALFGALSLWRARLDGRDKQLPGCPNILRWMAATNAPFDRREAAYRKRYPLPASLVELLGVAGAHFLPEALETCAAVNDWAECNPGQINLPARVGKRTFSAGKTPVQQSLRPDTQWVFQRAIAPLGEEMASAERDALSELLGAIGFERLGEFRPAREVLQEHYQYTVNLKASPASEEERETSRKVGEALIKAREAAGATQNLDRMIIG